MTASAARARVLTAVVLTGLGLFLVMRQQQQPVASSPGTATTTTGAAPTALRPAGPAPQDAIYAMFDAARAGDVDGYTRWYAGELARSLGQSVAEQGRERFARYLADTHAPVKGLAVEAAAVGQRRARMRVEYVYSDRNEAQMLELERPEAAGGEWRIVRVDRMQPVKTAVPYGSPAQQ